ncbi:MAG TPA: cupredoxin domain-containing protein [Vicinamibacterales bacterium]
MRYVQILSGLLGALLVTWSIADGLDARAMSAQAAPRPVKAFEIVAERFSFAPNHIEVTRGDHVSLTVRSADGTHGLAIKKLKLDIQVPKGGEPVVVEFDADQVGSFPIACSEYCGRGHSQMKGILVVNEAGGPGTAR